METFIWIIHVLTALTLIGLVLLQHGKGADMGAAFGSGSSGSLFGASGSSTFLSRGTAVLAAVFFVTSLGLTYLSTQRPHSLGVMERTHRTPVPANKAAAPVAPKAPATTPSKAREIPN